jgi:hypothetical protein
VFLVPDPRKLVPEKVHDVLVKVFFSFAIRFFTDVLCELFLLLAQAAAVHRAAVHRDKQSLWDAAGAGRGWWSVDSMLYCDGGLVLDVFEEIDQR